MPGRSTAGWTALCLAGLVGSGFWARAWGLSAYELSPDDVFHLSIAAAARSGDVVAHAAREVVHPPGLFLLLHGMLGIGEGELFLRSVALVPGLASIPLAFALGRRCFGTAAGLFLAFAFTFSYAHVLLSQVIREYALLLLLLLGGLLCVSEDQRRSRRALAWLYAALMAAAVLVHHSAVIPAVGIGALHGGRWLARRGRDRRLSPWIGAHALVATAFLASYLLLIRPLLDSPFRSDAVAGYLGLAYPGSAASAWARNLGALLLYLTSPFRPAVAIVFGALVASGVLLLCRRGRWEVALVALAPLALNALLAWLELYPFYGSRHCVYLLPLLLLPAAFCIQWGAEGLLALARRLRAPSWLGPSLGSAALLMATAGAAGDVGARDHYREAYAITEFPLTRRDYERTLAFFERSVAPGELVVADEQVARYAFREGSIEQRERLRPGLARTPLRGHRVYYDDGPRLVLATVGELRGLLAGVREVEAPGAGATVWLFTLGYRNSLLYTLLRSRDHATLPRGLPPAEREWELRQFARLQQALARWAHPVSERGDADGGSLLYAVPWSVLERGVLGAPPPPSQGAAP